MTRSKAKKMKPIQPCDTLEMHASEKSVLEHDAMHFGGDGVESRDDSCSATMKGSACFTVMCTPANFSRYPNAKPVDFLRRAT